MTDESDGGRSETEGDEDEDLGEYHEPTDEAFACFQLELHRPLMEGDDKSTRAWKEIRSVHRTVNQALQRGLGDVVVHVRNLRAAGKTRFATPSEKSNARLGVPLPSECYSEEDIKPFATMVATALKSCGVSEYVYASIARRVTSSELAGEKLTSLLRGENAYPVIHSAGIMMRSRNWRLLTEPRISGGKEYVDVVVEIKALRPHQGGLKLIAKRLHGPKLSRAKESPRRARGSRLGHDVPSRKSPRSTSRRPVPSVGTGTRETSLVCLARVASMWRPGSSSASSASSGRTSMTPPR